MLDIDFSDLAPYILPFGTLVGLYVFWKGLKPKLFALQQISWAFIFNHVTNVMNECYEKGNRKESLFAAMHDQVKNANGPLQVLEVGAGAGANFKYLPQGTAVTCLEPNGNFKKHLYTRAKKHNVEVKDFITGYAEEMSTIPMNSIDAVITTLVLCSVTDVAKSLSEIKRVLKPGGKLYYLEHVASKDSLKLFLQKLLRWLWRTLMDGCILDRETGKLIKKAGFTRVETTEFIASELKVTFIPIRPHIVGIATK